MSALQKLFNFVHSCPRASHFKVRDLNVYFKEAINPTYKLLNLDNIDFLELQVENEDKDYNLIAYITKNGKENSVLLATFETKKEAETALHKVKNKLFGGGKTLLTIANSIVLIIVYTTFVFGLSHSFKSESSGMPNLSGLSSTGLPNISLGNGGNAGNVSMSDMSKLQKQLLQQALQQAQQQGITGIGTGTGGAPSLPNLASSTSAMNDIVSGAIAQAQGQSPVDGMPAPQSQPIPQVVEHSSAGDDLLKQIK